MILWKRTAKSFIFLQIMHKPSIKQHILLMKMIKLSIFWT